MLIFPVAYGITSRSSKYVYAWASLIYQELLNEIRRARRQMIEDEDKGASSHSYGGCFLALQLWICEILGLGQAEREGCCPRILAWGRDGMKEISKKFSRLQPANIKPALAPLQCELHLLDVGILATPYRVLGGLALHSGPSSDATLKEEPDHKKLPRSAVDMRVAHIRVAYMAAKKSASVKARQELESLRRVNVEQEKRIMELEAEVRLLQSHAASSQQYQYCGGT